MLRLKSLSDLVSAGCERQPPVSGGQMPTEGSCVEFLFHREERDQIWAECFGRNPSDMKPGDSYAITAMMTQISGWIKTEKSVRLSLYGRQRVYERDPDMPVFLD